MPAGKKRAASKTSGPAKKNPKKNPKVEKKESGSEEAKPKKTKPEKKSAKVTETTSVSDSETSEVESVPKESSKGKSKKEKVQPIWNNPSALPAFTPSAESSEGNVWNWKFSSWNVNGIRAWLKSNGQKYIEEEQPDVFCIQETKASSEKIPPEARLKGYHCYFTSADKEGYAGTGLYSKQKPIAVTYGIGVAEHDDEGRVITAEYQDFYVVTAYVPNAGRGLVRLTYRTVSWDVAFRDYLRGLDEKKPVIMCGDLNVAHKELDLRNPSTNKKTAGFTDEERNGFTSLLEAGFTDTFRHLYPDTEFAYSFWSYMMNARGKNTGWRLDYFIISDRLKPKLCDSLIRTQVMGSDHCPVVLLLAL